MMNVNVDVHMPIEWMPGGSLTFGKLLEENARNGAIGVGGLPYRFSSTETHIATDGLVVIVLGLW